MKNPNVLVLPKIPSDIVFDVHSTIVSMIDKANEASAISKPRLVLCVSSDIFAKLANMDAFQWCKDYCIYYGLPICVIANRYPTFKFESAMCVLEQDKFEKLLDIVIA